MLLFWPTVGGRLLFTMGLIMKPPMGSCGTIAGRPCAGLLGLDLSWLMEGAGPALGDLGARRLSTSMLIAPVVSAQVAPSLVVGFALAVVVGSGRCCCWSGAIG